MKKLSVVLATRNEENNIADCINSVKKIADEIIVVDESSEDETRKIAKSLGAKVFKVKHSEIFHKTKQLALDKAKEDWILQLDADERVTKNLADEIKKVINMSNEEIKSRNNPYPNKEKLFNKHMNLVNKVVDFDNQSAEVTAFLLPRLNYFLGKPLTHAGVYPDPAIRLVKKGKTFFPAKSVHENMVVKGNIAWLYEDLEHIDSPTFYRYMERFNRYTDLHASDLKKQKVKLTNSNLIWYSFPMPFINFIKLYVLHAGFKDGMRGFIWSTFSSLHFPVAYFKYWEKHND